jgi:hypothetical protein
VPEQEGMNGNACDGNHEVQLKTSKSSKNSLVPPEATFEEEFLKKPQQGSMNMSSCGEYTLDGIKTITTYDLTGCWMHCALPVGWACVRVSPSDGSPDILVENGVFFFATVIPCPVTDVEMARKPGTNVFQAGEIRGGVVIDDVPTSQYVFKNSCFRFCDDGCCSCKVTP